MSVSKYKNRESLKPLPPRPANQIPCQSSAPPSGGHLAVLISCSAQASFSVSLIYTHLQGSRRSTIRGNYRRRRDFACSTDLHQLQLARTKPYSICLTPQLPRSDCGPPAPAGFFSLVATSFLRRQPGTHCKSHPPTQLQLLLVGSLVSQLRVIRYCGFASASTLQEFYLFWKVPLLGVS